MANDQLRKSVLELGIKVKLLNCHINVPVRPEKYVLNSKEIREVQTIAFECAVAAMRDDYPDGKIGPKTRAFLKDHFEYGIDYLTKAAFDDIVASDCVKERKRWVAVSVASDGAYGAVASYELGVAAFDAALALCKKQSNLPANCNTMAVAADPDAEQIDHNNQARLLQFWRY